MGDLHEMRTETGGRRVRRLSLATGLAIAVAIGALLQGGFALGGSSKKTTPLAAAAKPVVGEVTFVTGTKELYLQDDDGHKTALHRGDKLRLGSTVLMGAGVKAELKLSRPKSISPDRELVYVKPLDNSKPLVTLVRINDTDVRVKITD